MARMNGLSTFTSSEVRTFDAYLSNTSNLSNHFQLYEKIKEYYSNRSNHSSKKVIFHPKISKQDVYNIEKETYLSDIKISGIIKDNTINDNDVFEEIYSFLEFLFIELKLSSLTFLFHGFNEYKIYDILPNLKKS